MILPMAPPKVVLSDPFVDLAKVVRLAKSNNTGPERM